MEVPWLQLRKVIGGSDGVVVLGFSQLDVREGTWRVGTGDAASVRGRWATPWNQIEAGMAIMQEVPVLVAADDLVEEGVFAPSTWGEGVYGTPLTIGAVADGATRGWARAVLTSARARKAQPER